MLSIVLYMTPLLDGPSIGPSNDSPDSAAGLLVSESSRAVQGEQATQLDGGSALDSENEP